MSGISRDEWMRALQEANIPTEDDRSAMTAAELAAMLGIDHQAANRRLKALERAGKATRTPSARRPVTAGRISRPRTS